MKPRKWKERRRDSRVLFGWHIIVSSIEQRSANRKEERVVVSMAASRSTLPLIKYLRVRVDALPPLTLTPNFFVRRFCEEVRGCFLDKSEVTDRVISCVKNFQKVDPSKVNPNAHFQNDLGLDSLDAVEIVMALEEEFGFEIPDNEADKINSIKLAVDFISSHPQAK